MKNMKRNVQQGFTLIELMIVIAIVAILVALAVPAYQDYTIRARVSECINGAAPIKLAVAEHFMTNNAWPTAAELSLTDTTTNECMPIVYTGGAATVGVITVLADSDNKSASAKLTGSDNNGTVQWVCTNAGSTALAKYLPSTCRTGGTT